MNAGDAGTTTAELKSMFKSYEITFRFVISATVMGTEIRPGVAFTIGNDTETPANACGASLETVHCSSVEVCEKIGAILLFNPKS